MLWLMISVSAVTVIRAGPVAGAFSHPWALIPGRIEAKVSPSDAHPMTEFSARVPVVNVITAGAKAPAAKEVVSPGMTDICASRVASGCNEKFSPRPPRSALTALMGSPSKLRRGMNNVFFPLPVKIGWAGRSSDCAFRKCVVSPPRVVDDAPVTRMPMGVSSATGANSSAAGTATVLRTRMAPTFPSIMRS